MTKEYTAAELRELDVRVALEIFNWRWFLGSDLNAKESRGLTIYPPSDYPEPSGITFGSTYYPQEEDVTGNEAKFQRAWNWDHSIGRDKRHLPRYTTDPAAFMALWDKLREHRGVSISASQDHDVSCSVKITLWYNGTPGQKVLRDAFCMADNIMIALVLAALAACEEQK